MRKTICLAALLALSPVAGHAVKLDLEAATERAMTADPRIAEQQDLVRAAQALVHEATGSDGLRLELNSFVGLAPGVSGGLFADGATTCTSPCALRDDGRELDGVGLWAGLELALIKPLHTFGKIEHYSDAARGQVAVREGDVALQRAATAKQVAQAYYGYIAARDGVSLLADVDARIGSALAIAQRWIDEGRGTVVMSDVYALQTGQGLIRRELAQARAIVRIAEEGLRLLTGLAPDEPLEVAERFSTPLRVELEELGTLQQRAIEQRPEMAQLEAGLQARRALVQARRAEQRPNLYAGVVGSVAMSSNRDHLDNPHVYDPFSHVGATPVVGMQWSWAGSVQTARIAGSQAELDALLDKAAFAQQGIPFEVAEAYHRVTALQVAVDQLAQASRSGRRWMLAVYADFEAGFEDAREVFTAFQAYVLAHAEYLAAVNDLNVGVAELRRVTGDMP